MKTAGLLMDGKRYQYVIPHFFIVPSFPSVSFFFAAYDNCLHHSFPPFFFFHEHTLYGVLAHNSHLSTRPSWIRGCCLPLAESFSAVSASRIYVFRYRSGVGRPPAKESRSCASASPVSRYTSFFAFFLFSVTHNPLGAAIGNN